MSASSRLISGTAAAWAQIGITLITQVALVPLYLSYWDVKTYGLWLAILSLAGLLTAVDMGYQEYLGYEFLRIGKKDRRTLSKYLSSGIFVGLLLGAMQLLLITGIVVFGSLPLFFDELAKPAHKSLLFDAGLVLLMQGAAWLICGSIGGILTRSLSTFGYHPRMAWWGVLSSSLMNFAPAVMVVFGADLLKTGITVAVVRILADIPLYIDMLRLLHKEKIYFVRPSVKLGWTIFLKSIILSVTSLLENFRQQGARVLLTPFAGAAGLAAFSTMRTGSNVAMQGLHTVTYPLMPELMRFLHNRDQARSEMAFGTVWIVTVMFLAPAVVGLQSFVEPLYTTWTRGQITFDPWLFAILSLSVLVYATAQPAISVVRGNNLLKPQITISAICAVITLTGIYLLVPILGILGAGISLLTAEITANIAYRSIAKRWLAQNGLLWPKQSFLITVTSVWIAAAAMSSMIVFNSYKWYILALFISLLYYNSRRYWLSLPSASSSRAMNLITNMPGIKLLFPR